MVFAAPYVILPLFNRFTPLAEGELARAIRAYAASRAFRLKGIFTMDGSRRSAKSNAFFTGFGRSRRIVLFDTLIERHSVEEMVAIVAHEMGHYRLRHVAQALLRSLALALLTFALLGFFMKNPRLFAAFGFPPEHVSTYASLVLFAFLYTPLGLILSVVESAVSRRHEYAADRYAIETCNAPDALVTALKKLSVDNLANLAPHPLKVALSYSHPPMLQRIAAIRRRLRTPPTPAPPP
jgi:STE24 endopeptidase